MNYELFDSAASAEVEAAAFLLLTEVVGTFLRSLDRVGVGDGNLERWGQCLSHVCSTQEKTSPFYSASLSGVWIILLPARLSGFCVSENVC